jgi:hypothetical protein
MSAIPGFEPVLCRFEELIDRAARLSSRALRGHRFFYTSMRVNIVDVLAYQSRWV